MRRSYCEARQHNRTRMVKSSQHNRITSRSRQSNSRPANRSCTSHHRHAHVFLRNWRNSRRSIHPISTSSLYPSTCVICSYKGQGKAPGRLYVVGRGPPAPPRVQPPPPGTTHTTTQPPQGTLRDVGRLAPARPFSTPCVGAMPPLTLVNEPYGPRVTWYCIAAARRPGHSRSAESIHGVKGRAWRHRLFPLTRLIRAFCIPPTP